MSLPLIALEEQYISSNAFTAVPPELKSHFETFKRPSIRDKLTDLAPTGVRSAAMDAGDVHIAVLSNVPGFSSFPHHEVTKANDELAAATKVQPRFQGFAALPMHEPEAAAGELRRCVRELGFVGALVDSHLANGTYYDDAGTWAVFAEAERLDVPIYIHPAFPTKHVQAALYEGNYPAEAAAILGIAAWGWHSDTALCLLRMYSSGLFVEYPRLKIIIGHMGEMLPFMLTRIDQKLKQSPWEGAATSFRTVWERNVWVTTSGMFDLAPLACLLSCTPVDHVLYSVDYPWSDFEQGKAFLEAVRASRLVGEDEMEMIACKNAQRLWKISPQGLS